MKKVLSSSIITLVVSILSVFLNGFLGFIFFLTLDIANSLGGEVQNANATLISIMLVALMILSIINIIFAISTLIRLKRNTLNNLWAVTISLIITIVLNIVLAILIASTWAIIVYVICAGVYIISAILLLISFKTIRNY